MAIRLTRRRFLCGLGAAAVASGAYALWVEPHFVSITERDLPIARLPSALNGRLLVQISDLHIGPVDDDYLLGCFAKVNALHPDLLLITGDYMTCRHDEQIEHVGRLLSTLNKPPLGVFGSMGNHDYGPYWMHSPTADRLVRTLAAVGIPVLRNEKRDVEGLQLVGLDDLWAGRFAPTEVLLSLDPARAALVMSHNPDTLDRDGWSGYQGWILSGHTHGGQCKPPFLDPPVIPVMNQRYTSGEIDLGDGRRVYINRGLGYNRQIRFNARPEITAFTMRQA